jgi:hypothetical protein
VKLEKKKEEAPDTVELVLHLIGRICLVENEGAFTALMLDAAATSSLTVRTHRPILRVPLDDTTQAAADSAVLTFADQNGRAHAAWDLAGYDMEFGGLEPVEGGNPSSNLAAIVDLKAAYATIDPQAEWLGPDDLLTPGVRPPKVISRLSLRGFESIDSMYFGPGRVLVGSEVPPEKPADLNRIFRPGTLSQTMHPVVRCVAKFRTFAEGRPFLKVTSFTTGDTHRLEFDDGSPLQITISNMCTCVGDEKPPKITIAGLTHVKEDAEFALFYELLKEPPAEAERPVPFVREGASGQGVPDCVPVSQMKAGG